MIQFRLIFFLLFSARAYAIPNCPEGVDLSAIPSGQDCSKSSVFVEDTGTSSLQTVARRKTPIEFVPFKISDFCKKYDDTVCVEKYKNPGELFTQRDAQGFFFFDGTIQEYLDYLNEQERVYNETGYTLRPQSPGSENESISNSFEIPTSETEMKTQLLGALKLSNPKTLENILGINPKESCPKFPVPGYDNELPGFQYPRIRIKGVIDMRLDELLRRFNKQQEILCSLGFSFFDYISLDSIEDPKVLAEKILELKDKLTKEIGLSQYSEYFSMESVEAIQSTINVVKQINDLISGKTKPSPEQLLALRQELNAVLPSDYVIPDIPNIPAPTPPSRMYLKIKKRKDWNGFNFGSKDRVGTYGSAYLEIRGSEDEQESTAFGAAGLYILNQDINMIGGYAYAFASPKALEAELTFKVFGQNVFPPKKYKESEKIVVEDASLWDWEFDQAYRSSFMVGPVPVTLTAGARAKLGVGMGYGVYKTQLKATITPYASALAYASATAGIPKLLAVGAEAKLMLLDASLPISGYSGVNFDEVGYPYLKLGIDAIAQYEAMNGAIFA